LPFVLRQARLAAAVLFLVTLPIGDVTLLFALSLLIDLAFGLLALRRIWSTASSRVDIRYSSPSLALLRRTVPALRMRRPVRVVEAQTRWRQAAETRRRFREMV
jgi:hypothetical protein